MSRSPWFKVWRDKLLGSPRVRRLKPWDFGIYMRLMSHADETGALISGTHVWTLDDICRECEAPRAQKKVGALLARMCDPNDPRMGGLMCRRMDDGAYVIANFARLQRKPTRNLVALPNTRGRRGKGIG